MKDFEKLSERQRNILRFMERYINDNGFPPTIRDIGAATGIDSTSVVNYNLNKLVKAGFLERVAAKSRGMRLVRPLPGSQQTPIRPTAEVVQVPMVGRIAAGQPVNVPDNLYADMENPVELPASMLAGVNLGEVYALTVKGDSMIDAMIRDGDIIIMRHTSTAHNGDMVAVWLDEREETTLKYFYDEGERIRLQPAHPTMDPIYVDARQCHIQGRVLSVIRQMR